MMADPRDRTPPPWCGRVAPAIAGATMQRVSLLGSAFVVVGMLVSTSTLEAQRTVGADMGLYSSYVWRGLSLTNRPVAQPDLYLTLPSGKASVTLGAWANVDLGRYDDTNGEISESGALSALNLAEVDPWAEVSFPAGAKTTVTAGAIGYIYPNAVGGATDVNEFGLLTSSSNTLEIYGKVALAVPLSPKLTVWYDVDKIHGAYFEGSLTHTVPAGDKASLVLGAVAGFSAGQGVPDSGDDSFNFAGTGFTHLDLSAGLPLSLGALSITPALHVLVDGDDRVRISSPTSLEKGLKLWGGATISWARPLGGAAPEAPGATKE
jgi:hypothetical protein